MENNSYREKQKRQDYDYSFIHFQVLCTRRALPSTDNFILFGTHQLVPMMSAPQL